MTVEITGSRALRVVIVDDTEDLRELLRHALTRGGMTVVGEAGDGQQGIEVVRALQPDVVLLDLSMPVMDGLEALPHIRAFAPQTRIIVLSGFEARQMSERALKIGADGYLQKGAALGRILDQIRDIVGDRTGPPISTAATPILPWATTKAVPVAAQPQWDAVSLAPFGIVEVAAEPPYRLMAVNETGRALLCADPTPGEPVSEVAPEIFTAIVNSRLSGDCEFEASLHQRPVRVTLRHTATSLLLYLHEITDEIGHLRNAIATTAHELRGPVTVLGAITEAIREDDLDLHHIEQLMISVSRQSRLLDSITGDLLVAAQVERGTLLIEPQEIDLPALVVEAMADHNLARRALEVADDRPVRADPLRLLQMLGNLISNAHKYGEPPVQLRIRPSTQHESLVSIDVEDHGPGVPADFQTQLFHEFSRAGGTATTAGTGLGLNVVQTLAQGHGGSVAYTPRLGGGAIFTLSLPAATR